MKKVASIRFLAHSVTNGAASARVTYSAGRHYVSGADGQFTGDTVPVVSIYAKDYIGSGLREIFGDLYVNNSDSMTDYFEKGHVVLTESHPLYVAASERARINREKNEARWAASQARRAAKFAARRSGVAA